MCVYVCTCRSTWSMNWLKKFMNISEWDRKKEERSKLRVKHIYICFVYIQNIIFSKLHLRVVWNIIIILFFKRLFLKNMTKI